MSERAGDLPADASTLDRDGDLTGLQCFALLNLLPGWESFCDPQIMLGVRVDADVSF